MTNKKKLSLPKPLRDAAVIVFGGAALLGAGYGAQRVVDIFSAPPPVVQQAPLPEQCETKLSVQFNGKSWQDLREAAPRGDGHPVLVIPGFMTGDFYMSELRDRIEAQGYKAYGWDEGMNLGASRDDAEKLAQRLKDISRENGGQKVSIVGYSLGGVYGRELARKYPELVRDVITLGAPFGGRDWSGRPDETLARIYNYYQHKDAQSSNDLVNPPPMPTTSVYSKGDWIVNWSDSQNPRADKAENVEIRGGHVRMPFNDEAAAIVLNRLAQKEGAWTPYWQGVCELPATRFAGQKPRA